MLILLMVIDFSFKELISSLGPFYEVLCRRHMDAAHHHSWTLPPPRPGLQKSPQGEGRHGGRKAAGWGAGGTLRKGHFPALSSSRHEQNIRGWEVPHLSRDHLLFL